MRAIKLCSGAGNGVNKACWMTAISMYEEQGVNWGDQPQCVSPTIRAACIRLNDAMPDDETRAQYIGPVLFLPLGTAPESSETAVKRGFVAADWAVRRLVPVSLELLGRHDLATRLRELSPIVDIETAHAARDAARDAADAAYTAAYAADTAADAANAAYTAGAAYAAANAANAAYAAHAAYTAGAAYAAADAAYTAANAANAADTAAGAAYTADTAADAANAAHAAANAAKRTSRDEIWSLGIQMIEAMCAIDRVISPPLDTEKATAVCEALSV